MVDDVLDLVRQEPEVDRDEDPPISAHPVERDQEPGGVRADDGYAFLFVDAHLLEGQRHAPSPAPRAGRR